MANLRCQSRVELRFTPLVGAVAVVAATVVAFLTAGPARAAAPDAHGYWWRLQQGVPVGAVSPAPEGGLWVAADPTGPQAVSAVRFAAAAGETAEALTLEVAAADGEGAIAACPATSAWEAPEGAGAWTDAPAWDCERTAVEGSFDEDGATWTVPLAGLTADDGAAVDIVLVPAGAGPFSVTFAPPGDGAIATRPVAAPAPLPAPAPSPAVAPERTEPTSDFTPPPLGAGALPYEPAPDSPPPPRPVAPRPAADPGLAAAAAPDSEGGGSRQPLALLIAAVVVGTWVVRTRLAVAAAGSHPLAAPLAGAATPGALAAETLLLGDAGAGSRPAERTEVVS